VAGASDGAPATWGATWAATWAGDPGGDLGGRSALAPRLAPPPVESGQVPALGARVGTAVGSRGVLRIRDVFCGANSQRLARSRAADNPTLPFHEGNLGGEGEIRTHGTLVQRFSRVHQSGRTGPSAFDLHVRAFDLAPCRPPLFAGEDASEAAMSRPPDHHLGRATGPRPAITHPCLRL
jgi:hypothetical protein